MARPAKPMFAPDPAIEAVADGALSIDGAAAFCGDLCRREVERAVKRGELETFHFGRRVLIPKSEVRRWLAAHLEAERAKRTGRA